MYILVNRTDSHYIVKIITLSHVHTGANKSTATDKIEIMTIILLLVNSPFL